MELLMGTNQRCLTGAIPGAYMSSVQQPLVGAVALTLLHSSCWGKRRPCFFRFADVSIAHWELPGRQVVAVARNLRRFAWGTQLFFFLCSSSLAGSWWVVDVVLAPCTRERVRELSSWTRRRSCHSWGTWFRCEPEASSGTNGRQSGCSPPCTQPKPAMVRL
jgi:hypothetical protein